MTKEDLDGEWEGVDLVLKGEDYDCDAEELRSETERHAYVKALRWIAKQYQVGKLQQLTNVYADKVERGDLEVT